ncbi:MauE/DoxX family redox-associated membrane protein [Nonomuraea sp. NPDC001831]|uniref:MauE/DoxX family redox-associated membrane protein n=1 Tax=Nonomuraea sp. NPDC001831 TaxID=3364340 RepID=UPI00368DE141
MEYLAVGIRWLIGVVFLVSFANKVAGRKAFNSFVASIQETSLVPSWLAGPAALVVVGCEASICMFLALPVWAANVVGYLVACGLLASFVGVITLMIRRGTRHACHCFGSASTLLGMRHVVRNAILIGMCIIGMAAHPPSGSMNIGEWALAAVAGLVVGGTVTQLDTIAELFQPTSG